MTLHVRPAAQKGLAGIPKAERDALVEKLRAIANDPYGEHPYAKRLQGRRASAFVRGWRGLPHRRQPGCDRDRGRAARECVSMNQIRPISETTESVTLNRSDFDAEELEDAADRSLCSRTASTRSRPQQISAHDG